MVDSTTAAKLANRLRDADDIIAIVIDCQEYGRLKKETPDKDNNLPLTAQDAEVIIKFLKEDLKLPDSKITRLSNPTYDEVDTLFKTVKE